MEKLLKVKAKKKVLPMPINGDLKFTHENTRLLDEDQLRSMNLEAERVFDGPITRAHAKKMVNEAQSKMENIKPKPKLVNCLRNKKNELN
ncbi:hypothetical protein GmHk_10G028694 [Glycine max]|nr:hypothetical protein GmHk_10G028694 [Glycine max]